MTLNYVINPKISAQELSSLRRAVGWDSREDKLEKTIGSTYLSAACYDKDKIVGFVDVISDGVDDALIRSLIVDPNCQRKGIALKLLNIVTGKIREDRIKTINVLFEPELSSLYRKAGFRMVGGGLIDNEEEF